MTIRGILEKDTAGLNEQFYKSCDKLYRTWKHLINSIEDGDIVLVSSIRCLNDISYKELDKLTERVPVILTSDFCTTLFMDEDGKTTMRHKILRIREQLI